MATPVTIVTANGVPVTPVTTQADVTGLTTADTPTFAGIILTDLPTVDPAVNGQLWLDSGVLTVSAG